MVGAAVYCSTRYQAYTNTIVLLYTKLKSTECSKTGIEAVTIFENNNTWKKQPFNTALKTYIQ